MRPAWLGWGPCIILTTLLSLTCNALGCTNSHMSECYSCLIQSLHYVLGSALQTFKKKSDGVKPTQLYSRASILTSCAVAKEAPTGLQFIAHDALCG